MDDFDKLLIAAKLAGAKKWLNWKQVAPVGWYSVIRHGMSSLAGSPDDLRRFAVNDQDHRLAVTVQEIEDAEYYQH